MWPYLCFCIYLCNKEELLPWTEQWQKGCYLEAARVALFGKGKGFASGSSPSYPFSFSFSFAWFHISPTATVRLLLCGALFDAYRLVRQMLTNKNNGKVRSAFRCLVFLVPFFFFSFFSVLTLSFALSIFSLHSFSSLPLDHFILICVLYAPTLLLPVCLSISLFVSLSLARALFLFLSLCAVVPLCLCSLHLCISMFSRSFSLCTHQYFCTLCTSTVLYAVLCTLG